MLFRILVSCLVTSLCLSSLASHPPKDISKDNLSIFTWVPDGKRLRELPPQCGTDKLEKMIRQAPTPFERSTAVNNFFQICDQYLTLMGESGITNILQLFSIDYEYESNPHIRKVTIRLKDNIVMQGVLGLKPDKTPRPLIIMQSGLTTGTEDSSSVRWRLMHLFDEAPFHVLILGSSTSSEFGLSNKLLYAGGHQEGQNVYEIARWLKFSNEELKDRISSVHVAGDSLGGHASLYATLYNDIDPHSNGHKVFNSALGLCPVVDLEPAINNIMQDTLTGKYLQEKIWWELKKMLGRVPVLDRLIPDGKKPSPNRIKEIVAEFSLDFYSRPFRDIFELLFRIIIPKSLNEYWAYNNFVDLGHQITTPLAIWSADDDPAINSRENSLRLMDMANRQGSPVQILNTAIGSHCGFGLSHGWDVFSTFLRSQVLANSPEFLNNYTFHKTPIENIQSEPVTVSENKRYFSIKFQAESKSSFLLLTHQIFNPRILGCSKVDPFLLQDEDCFEFVSTRINLQRLGIPVLRVPQNVVEAQALTRWANANLQLVDQAGDSIVNTQNLPAFVTWQEVAP